VGAAAAVSVDAVATLPEASSMVRFSVVHPMLAL
jgi:hypothetical protein